MDRDLLTYLKNKFTPEDISELSNFFKKNGFVKISNIVPDIKKEQINKEVYAVLTVDSERRDLTLDTTGGTPRKMSVVRSEIIAKSCPSIANLSRSEDLLNFLSKITKEKLYKDVLLDEEYLITKQELPGDTHGWHWGDYSFAMIWIIKTPPIEDGGMLQCVPHTNWNKENPNINNILCKEKISTYGFTTGDIYLLKTDTTLHRTVPLNKESLRIILNMTWSSENDLKKELNDDDRWWDDSSVNAAHQIDVMA